ncbi:hypothetical protein D3C72_1857630 [compost metagenome]
MALGSLLRSVWLRWKRAAMLKSRPVRTSMRRLSMSARSWMPRGTGQFPTVRQTVSPEAKSARPMPRLTRLMAKVIPACQRGWRMARRLASRPVRGVSSSQGSIIASIPSSLRRRACPWSGRALPPA